jgi:hypothetical protein
MAGMLNGPACREHWSLTVSIAGKGTYSLFWWIHPLASRRPIYSRKRAVGGAGVSQFSGFDCGCRHKWFITDSHTPEIGKFVLFPFPLQRYPWRAKGLGYPCVRLQWKAF